MSKQLFSLIFCILLLFVLQVFGEDWSFIDIKKPLLKEYGKNYSCYFDLNSLGWKLIGPAKFGFFLRCRIWNPENLVYGSLVTTSLERNPISFGNSYMICNNQLKIEILGRNIQGESYVPIPENV
jgi:hypothetical protein